MSLRRPVQVGMGVLATVVTEMGNKILAHLGDIRGATDSENAEWWQHVGFSSRPSKAVKGSVTAANAVVVQGGDRDTCIASQDARGLELYGRLKEGETAVYAAGEDGLSQARTLYKGDGTVNHFTTDTNTADGKSVYARVAPGLDARGMPDGFSWVAPWGTMKFDSTGFHITHVSGAAFDLGGIVLPGPLAQFGTYVKIQAATVAIESSALSQGVGAVDPLAKSTQVVAAIQALQAQITGLAAVVAAITVGPGAPVGPAAIAATTPHLAPVQAAALLIPATTAAS